MAGVLANRGRRKPDPGIGQKAWPVDLWAWGMEGRPVAVAEIWRWNQNRDRWGHAMVSTTPGRVMAQINDRAWRPDRPGFEFHPLGGVSAPSAVREDRARQAKELASKFSGFEVYRGERIDLELHSEPTYGYEPDPIYRYQSEGVDGSIFALTHYNNPEALLFIEAVEDPILPSYWRYAVAQVSSHELHVEYQGQGVVTIPEAAEYVGTPSDPFWVFYVQRSLDPPAHGADADFSSSPKPSGDSETETAQEDERRTANEPQRTVRDERE